MEVKKIEELEALAKNGDVGAIYELGQRYFKGNGVACDYNKAREYFEVAAERGSQGANYYLGRIYYNGNGVATNHEKAKGYFEKSANSGNVFSGFYLGKIYYWGDGVEKNVEKASELKDKIFANPIYTNQDIDINNFYSVTDFEEITKEYVDLLQAKVAKEYKNLFGKEII